VFGDDDEIGTLNFISETQIRAAVELVKVGTVLPLNLSIQEPSPALFHRSAPVKHTIVLNAGESIDDYLDNFFPHGSSHWDALRHYADREFGFYNGKRLEDVSAEDSVSLGVDHWARRGIVGRGVLLDFVSWHQTAGYDPLGYYPISAEMACEVARHQGVALRQGDIVLVRTGWLAAYTSLAVSEQRDLAARQCLAAPGLAGKSIAQLFWNRRVAASASDTPLFEAQRGGTFELDLHNALIARLGMPLGELWNLEQLAVECNADQRYDFLLTSAPLHIPGGSGSPANALAIR
jgi:kynurenine formamidase